MPEGPEIHRAAEKIRRALEGKVTNTNRSPLHRWSCDGYPLITLLQQSWPSS